MYSQIPRRYDSGSDTNGLADISRRPWGGASGPSGTGTGAASGPLNPVTTPTNPNGMGIGAGGATGIGAGGQYAHGQPYDPTPGTGSMGNSGTINFGPADQEGRGRNYDAGINVYYPGNNLAGYRPDSRPLPAYMLAPGYSRTLPNNPGGASEDRLPGGIGYGGGSGSGNVRPRPGAGGGGRPNMQPLVGSGASGNRPAIAPAVVGGWDNPMFNRRPSTPSSGPRMRYNGGSGGTVGLDSAEGESTPRMMPLPTSRATTPRPEAGAPVNGQVSGGGWTPAPIPSAQPINLGGLVGAITAGQQQAANQAAQQAANAAAAPGIIRIPQPGYFGNAGIGFGAGTANANLGGINMYGGGGRLYGDPINGTNWAGDLPQYATPQQAPYFGPGSPGYEQYVASQNGSAGAGRPGSAGGVTPAPITYDPNNPLGSIFGSFQQAQDSALAANEQRYQDILAGWMDTYNMALGDINNLGEQQRKDVRTDYMRQGEELKSSLVDRGMSNTTVRDTMLAGNLSEQENSLNRLEDSLIRERMNIALPLRTGMLGFMERREDQYPDMGQLMQLAQMLGMSGNGTGGGAGTNYGAISAAMQGIGNVGGFPGAGGLAGGFGGANGNMGNVWGGGGGGGGNQQGNQGGAAGQNQGPNLAQGNVAQVGIDKGLTPYQQELAAYNKLYGWHSNTDQLIKEWKKNNPGKSLTDVLNEQQQPANNQQAFNFQPAQPFQNVFDPYVFDYPTYDPYQNSYQDPYQGYYPDPYETPYDYSQSPGYYS